MSKLSTRSSPGVACYDGRYEVRLAVDAVLLVSEHEPWSTSRGLAHVLIGVGAEPNQERSLGA